MSSADHTISKYEYNLIIGLRATQLSQGAKPFIPLPPNFSIKSNVELLKIAKLEYDQHKVPYIIRRTRPDGSKIDVKL